MSGELESAIKKKTRANRVKKACVHCRKRKQGCDDQRPCTRCVHKNICCIEAEPRKKKIKDEAYYENKLIKKNLKEKKLKEKKPKKLKEIVPKPESDEDQSAVFPILMGISLGNEIETQSNYSLSSSTDDHGHNEFQSDEICSDLLSDEMILLSDDLFLSEEHFNDFVTYESLGFDWVINPMETQY